MITVSPEYLPTGKRGGKIPGIDGQREEKTGDKGTLVLCGGWAAALVLCGEGGGHWFSAEEEEDTGASWGKWGKGAQ